MTAGGVRRARRTEAFCIGHDASGELSVDDEQVGRAHVAVFLRDGQWWVRDLGSANGTMLDGSPVQSAPLPRRTVLAFGNPPVQVVLEVEVPEPPAKPTPNAAPPIAAAASRTVLAPEARSGRSPASSDAVPIHVRVGQESSARQFTDAIRVGRGEHCAIRIRDDRVSRMHAEIFRMGRHWCVRDLGSGNGTYLDGVRIEQSPLPARCTLRLGADGPTLELSYAAPAIARPESEEAPRSLEEVAAHYFDENANAPAGNRTMMVRRAFSSVKRQQKRRYGSMIAGAIGLLLVAVGVGIYQHLQLQRTREIAEQLFYNMKTVELQLARLEVQVQASGDAAQLAESERGRAQLSQMSTQYDALLEELGVLDSGLPPEDQLIIRVARVFGECELGMPKGFVDEVKRYIDVWRSDRRMASALQRAREQNLVPMITEIMVEHHLPKQFFYVALQESDFRPEAVGVETRFGIAKGMWQLMPETADQYGLRTGPLLAVPQFDPEDERFDPTAATEAAARYLGDLYRGEAQASGLLVLASYNWGTNRVRKRILEMKENPRDRNFWALLAQSDVPAETRDYVFLVFAAAVIGEDPALFGFDFDAPLANVESIPTRS
jgi:pSer/pThr/pTyr-binding forkhead associated (FHA) protein